MAFVITPVDPRQSGNVFRFWSVTTLLADTGESDWIAHGFQRTPQYARIYTVAEAAAVGNLPLNNRYAIEFNTVAVPDATVPGYSYSVAGVLYTIPATTTSVQAGGAWRIVKNVAGGAGEAGTVRVCIGAIPTDISV